MTSDVKNERPLSNGTYSGRSNDSNDREVVSADHHLDDEADNKPATTTTTTTMKPTTTTTTTKESSGSTIVSDAASHRPSTVSEESDDQRTGDVVDDDNDDEAISFSVRKPASVVPPRKTYGSKRRQQNAFNDAVVVAAENSSTTRTTNDAADVVDDVKPENGLTFSISTVDVDDDCLPTSSKRLRSSDSPPSTRLVDVNVDPAPFLGPDLVDDELVAIVDEKPKIENVDGEEEKPLPLRTTTTAVVVGDQASLITFDLDTLLTETSNADSSPCLSLVNGATTTTSIHPHLLASISGNGVGLGDGAMMIDSTTIASALSSNHAVVADDDDGGVDDPGAIYIQNLLNATASSSSSSSSASTMTAMKLGDSTTTTTKATTTSTSEILIDSDDEPEIVFVEEKFTSAVKSVAPKAKVRPITSKLGSNLLRNISSIKSTATGVGPLAATASGKPSDSRSTGPGTPPSRVIHSPFGRIDYYHDASKITTEDKFSYMKIRSTQSRKGRKKGKLIMDYHVSIPTENFQEQLKDTSDIIARLTLAPFSKRAMHMLEYGGIERAFSLPSDFYRDSAVLMNLFSGNLKTSTVEDETEAEIKALLGPSAGPAALGQSAHPRYDTNTNHY